MSLRARIRLADAVGDLAVRLLDLSARLRGGLPLWSRSA